VAPVELLLARGADPIEAGAEPWATPLAWAERRHHAGITSILRQHELADRGSRTSCGPAALRDLTTLVLTNAESAFERSLVQHPLDDTRKQSGRVTVRFCWLGH